jgi:hypothetical protein
MSLLQNTRNRIDEMKKVESPLPVDQKSRRALKHLGLYVLFTMLVSCVALIINVALVFAWYTGIAQIAITEAYSKKMGQFVLLIVPFLLLFPEWLVYDILVAPFRSKR